MGFIKFLGSAGARFVVMKQLRASGGIWLQFKSTNIIIDPGPGAIVKCNSSRPKLDPGKLDAIILTHKHLDHSSDVNIMVEAMTEGGFKKRGALFVPSDALGTDGVIFSYLKDYPKETIILNQGKFSIRDIDFEVPVINRHSVMTYGLKFYLGDEVVSFVSDTRYFDKLVDVYKDSTLIVLNVVFYERKDNYDHLCLDDAVKIIKEIKPKRVILTHFGMSMLKHKPYILESEVRSKAERDVKFAYDGLSVDLDIS